MIFYTIHHIVHGIFPRGVSEERKNLTTLLVGTFLWVML